MFTDDEFAQLTHRGKIREIIRIHLVDLALWLLAKFASGEELVDLYKSLREGFTEHIPQKSPRII